MKNNLYGSLTAAYVIGGAIIPGNTEGLATIWPYPMVLPSFVCISMGGALARF